MDRRFWGLPGRLSLGQRLDAGGAQALGDDLAVLHHLDLLHVHVPAATRRLPGPRTIVAEHRASAAILTLSHVSPPTVDSIWNWRQ